MSEARPDGRRQGRRVADRYQLLEPIGRGGMGIVWRAHDELLDRAVAVKEVRYPGDPQDDEVAELNQRTLREARAAGRLAHPNVVVVHDVIEENGRPWIVMQLVDSRSLGQVLRDDGPLPMRMVAEIGLQVLEALRSAHAAGVLHRDVKPENVLLTDDGRVVLTDFGIARMETDTTMTRTGLVGTPAFIAPERLRGYPAQRESDLWSLGATLYAAVEGRPPHDKGMAMATMHAVLNEEPEPALRAGRLGAVLSGLLEKDPDKRLGADQAERMLRSIAQDRSSVPTAAQHTMPATPLPAPPTSPPRKQPKPPRRPAQEEAAEAAAPAVPETGVRDQGDALRQVRSLRPAPGAGQARAAAATEQDDDAQASPADPAPETPRAARPATGAEEPEPSAPAHESEDGDAPADAGRAASSPAGAGKPAGERPERGAGAKPIKAPVQPVRPAARPIKAPVQPVRRSEPAERTDLAELAEHAEHAGERPAAALAGQDDPQRPTHVPRQQAAAETEARTRPETRKRPYGGAPYAAPADPVAASYEGTPAGATTVGPAVAGDDGAGASGGWSGSGTGGGERPPALRVALIAVPVVVIVAAVALWLGTQMASDGSKGGAASTGQATAPSKGSDAPSSPAPSTGASGSTGSASPAASATPSASPDEPKPSSSPKPGDDAVGPGDVPKGWHKYKHSSGFSIALPKGWDVDGRGNGEVRFRGDVHTYLEVHHTSQPKSDALETWKRDAPGMSGNFPGYKLIAYREVKGFWKTAADWEFTFGDSRYRSRVIDRGFVTDKNNGYALLFKTQEKGWKKKKAMFETMAATFEPAK
ncbi:hypothetical protein Sme01_62230 [Sphaerisporangium melleum]|uniref:non-specific serine/threonine protein kinase n=1 Tax=Sphaerisporangium melleum TaxID=321316 RepID=A0A917RBS8_9ACTN|nr:serine/threonine-protein kinase [Sphaerisporangium melleum]GGK98485.1 hypothetical protein GCM10007964_45850 [Sphaerisporangium melleum]GII73747.1 hypothetical protein Sme01_62230 [Sphaerisporangium melleum]